ncbi:alanine--tRNA ligase [Candidatus Woesearchaeota archaeon]|nr:alanine--tRNA ligase [Candidatus Woesearchaeota archaeon]
MPTDKEIKKEFKLKASKEPDKYYATSVLKEAGFTRKKCRCGIYFWTTNKKQETCGDAACSGGFRFFENNPCKKKLSYVDVWKDFSRMFEKLGYTPIKRYPVVARWRDDMDFVIASIADFQPYVVSGEVDPPANPLVVPQFCLRFGDIDNVGITGSHMTCFNMIGQHMFVSPKEWDQARVFMDIKKWLNDGMGIPDNEITFHEDAWAGGGNFGPCMEFFSRGVEIGNQVYMMFEQTEHGPTELKLKVLDMGMGMERCAWFSQGTPTIYDAVFPTVVEKLKKLTGINADEKLLKKFVPYAGLLNIDEIDDVDKAWKDVAKKTGVEVEKLKKEVLPMAAIYSIAEHTRGLLIALSDGALPSNVGGGYNLRVILRRALSFIDKYRWNIDLFEICREHARYLKPLFPELSQNLDDVKAIIEVEKVKYDSTKQKTRQIVEKIIGEKITENKLIELYDSQGISPELVAEEAAKQGKKVKIPDNFYAKVSERHEKVEQKAATKKEEKLDLEGVPATEALYFSDYSIVEFKAHVVKVIGKNVVLDKTYFYPTSGGQLHDEGKIAGEKVVDIFKQGNVIVHAMAAEPRFRKNDDVNCLIDWQTRLQLAQHHTATHIVNVAAKKLLGHHINQAGAKKTLEKAHLDITHYQSVSDEELKEIEKESNRIISEKHDVKTYFMSRNDAEKKFGMEIYQGGAVPGKQIRIVEIPGVDVEACGGTHVKNTADVNKIVVLKSTKISDGIVRLTFTAGIAAEKEAKEEQNLVAETAKILGVKESQIPARAEELFSKWKKAKKAAKKGKELKPEELKLTSTEEFEGDVLAKAAEIFKTQPEHVAKTAQRFLSELKEMKRKG